LWVEFSQEDEGTGFALGAAGDVDAGELQHELTGGFFSGRKRIRVEAEEFTGLLEEMFVTVGAQSEMPDSHEPAGQNVKQEPADEFVNFEGAMF
jgi:hypothetical protein